ncbi:MAG: hypothetical protein GTN64_05420 [Candidatus Latescibacteria bacterium]|nr:hypothetical protein [Candidatus Latescibacterota bacterium]NIO78049.1 hypothetical protein [Candidatus Latescibacterota bacterium]
MAEICIEQPELWERDPADYCELWRLTIQRQERDLEEGWRRGLFWNEAEAEKAAEFFPMFLRHSKGKWKGKPFELDHYQREHIIKPLFGWQKPNFEWDSSSEFDWEANPYDPARWVRRFNKAYLQLPKGTGKSTLAAGMGCILLFEGESVPELYSCGATREQAKLIHEEAKRMLKSAPALRSKVAFYRDAITLPDEFGKWVCFSRQATGSDGISTHGALVDELHQWAWSGKEILDIVIESGIKREQPLVVITTTAGESRESLCYQERVSAEKILRGFVQADDVFALVAEPTKDELTEHGWDSAHLAYIVNPGWGTNIDSHKVKAALEKAKQLPGERTKYKRYRLNLWVGEQRDKMFDAERFRDRRCSIWIPGLKKRATYLGVDMSESRDITALVALTPHARRDEYAACEWYWVPEDNVRKRVENDGVPYDQWIESGDLLTTPGNWIHHSAIEQQILSCCEFFDVVAVGIDAWNMGQLGPALQDDHGLAVVKIRQGTISLNDPCKFLQRVNLSRKIIHAGNPVTEWMISNCIQATDSAGNIKPDKKKSEEKIDYVSALATAAAVMLRKEQDNFLYDSIPLATLKDAL